MYKIIKMAMMMKKMLCIFDLSFTGVFHKQNDTNIKLSNHVFDWLPNARMHRGAVFTGTHFDWYLGDFVTFEEHFDDKAGIWKFWIVAAASVVVDDLFVEALKAGKRIGDFLLSK